jgi:hypothetical protein
MAGTLTRHAKNKEVHGYEPRDTANGLRRRRAARFVADDACARFDATMRHRSSSGLS